MNFFNTSKKFIKKQVSEIKTPKQTRTSLRKKIFSLKRMLKQISVLNIHKWVNRSRKISDKFNTNCQLLQKKMSKAINA